MSSENDMCHIDFVRNLQHAKAKSLLIIVNVSIHMMRYMSCPELVVLPHLLDHVIDFLDSDHEVSSVTSNTSVHVENQIHVWIFWYRVDFNVTSSIHKSIT